MNEKKRTVQQSRAVKKKADGSKQVRMRHEIE